MENIKGITNCNQCGRGCHVSALMCGRGIRYFELLQSQNEGEIEEKRECCGGHHHHHHDHEAGHKCGCGKHGEHRHGHGPLDELSELIGKCNNHITHRGKGRGQGKVLKILARNGEISQKDLQDMLEIQSGSISEVLAKLEDKGMITRIKSEDDKRKVIVSITEAGKEKAASCGCKNRAERLYAGLTEEEKEELKFLLNKLVNSWDCQE